MSRLRDMPRSSEPRGSSPNAKDRTCGRWLCQSCVRLPCTELATTGGVSACRRTWQPVLLPTTRGGRTRGHRARRRRDVRTPASWSSTRIRAVSFGPVVHQCWARRCQDRRRAGGRSHPRRPQRIETLGRSSDACRFLRKALTRKGASSASGSRSLVPTERWRSRQESSPTGCRSSTSPN